MKRICCTYLLLLTFVAAQGQVNVKAKTDNLPLDPAVRTGRLANGFTYYIRHNEEPQKRVVLYLANKVGSILENDNQQGLAHFMEHMSFNGTKHFPKSELVNYLQKSGVRFGADLNAYTSFDETVYQLPIPSDDPDLLAHGLQIMRDWAQEATLDPIEINKERGVVLEEKRLRKGASERLQKVYWPVLFNHSRYVSRIPIGTDEVLNTFTSEAIRSFYHDWYRPDLQALIVVGDIDVNSMEQAIKAKFNDLKNPVNEKPRTKYAIALNGKNQFIALTDKEQTNLTAEVIFKLPELLLHNSNDYRQQIIRGLFNQMLGARMAELSRQAEPPFVRGSAGIGGFLGGLDQYRLSVVAKTDSLEQALKAVLRENERVKRFGFTPSELDRAKQSYLNSMEAALKEQNKTASDNYVKEYLAYFLKGNVAPGIAAEFDLVKKNLPGIQLSELNSLAKTINGGTNRDVIILAPESAKASLPDEAKVSVWISSVQGAALNAYKDEVSSQPLLSAEPAAGQVVSAVKDPALGTTWLTLSNGVKVLLKPTKFKDNEIQFTGFAPGGTSLTSDADFQSAANSGIIPSFGAGNYNPTQLTKFLAGKQLGVRPFITERTQGISGISTNKDLETAMQLVYAYYTQPRKDEALFSSIITRSKASLLNRGNDPASVLQDSITAILGNHNPRRTGPSLDKLAEVDLDKAYSFYKDSFSNASGLCFTFVGSFDSDDIQPLIAKYLGGLPAGQEKSAKDLGIHVPEGRIEKNIYKGSEPKATVQLFWTRTFNYTTGEKIQLDALKECLEIRLLERLREDESGVYSPSVEVITNKLPQARYALIVNFGCAPQNVDKLIASTLAEIENLKAAGPPQANIAKWRAESLRARETEMQTNAFWLDYLDTQLQDAADLHENEGYSNELEKIKPFMLKAAAEKYLSGKNYIRLVLLPENLKVNQ